MDSAGLGFRFLKISGGVARIYYFGQSNAVRGMYIVAVAYVRVSGTLQVAQSG